MILGSALKSTNVNFGAYSHRKLSDRIDLYWRMLRGEGEIEVALVTKGNTYTALGWRPANTRASCQQFPYIADQDAIVYPKSKPKTLKIYPFYKTCP